MSSAPHAGTCRALSWSQSLAGTSGRLLSSAGTPHARSRSARKVRGALAPAPHPMRVIRPRWRVESGARHPVTHLPTPLPAARGRAQNQGATVFPRAWTRAAVPVSGLLAGVAAAAGLGACGSGSGAQAASSVVGQASAALTAARSATPTAQAAATDTGGAADAGSTVVAQVTTTATGTRQPVTTTKTTKTTRTVTQQQTTSVTAKQSVNVQVQGGSTTTKAAGSSSGGGGGLPGWAWALIGVGAAGLLIAAFAAGRHRQQPGGPPGAPGAPPASGGPQPPPESPGGPSPPPTEPY